MLHLSALLRDFEHNVGLAVLLTHQVFDVFDVGLLNLSHKKFSVVFCLELGLRLLDNHVHRPPAEMRREQPALRPKLSFNELRLRALALWPSIGVERLLARTVVKHPLFGIQRVKVLVKFAGRIIHLNLS